MTLRILIADSDDASRERMRRLLEKQVEWRVCASAVNGAEAVELAVRLSPQVAVIELALPGLNGLEAIRRIKRLRPDIEVLAVTAYETDDIIRDLLIAGAQACLLKPDIGEHLIKAVDALAQGRPYLTPAMMHVVLDVFLAERAGDKAARPSALLTAREREVLQLLAEGRNNSAISQLLGISVKTVETHRAAIMKKLSVSSLAELVRYAIRNGVIGNDA
jgi:DNA-binding NarL/FixJ family response regulator